MMHKKIKLKRQYSYIPYSFHRIKRILKESGLHLENIHAGYKGNRYKGYVEHYKIIDTATGKVHNERTNLHTLRCFFARQGIPEFDEKSSSKQLQSQRLIADQVLKSISNKDKK
ncbi:MAG: hypothetical protein LBE37_14350 [Sphingobacterium sp.]|jgi:hypothetical protein|nr:hypothetical protein [Sphingobacterium sp.]